MKLIIKKVMISLILILMVVGLNFCDSSSSDGDSDNIDKNSRGWLLIDNADNESLDEVYLTLDGQRYDILAQLDELFLASDEYLLLYFNNNPATFSTELVYNGINGADTQNFNDIDISFGQLYFIGWNHDSTLTQNEFRDPADYQDILNELGPRSRTSSDSKKELPFKVYILKK